jgi:hypothetical protein
MDCCPFDESAGEDRRSSGKDVETLQPIPEIAAIGVLPLISHNR